MSLFGLIFRLFARRSNGVTRRTASWTRPTSAPTLYRGEVYAQVLWVLDGDTVDVRLDGRKVRIRLYAIDCPEDGQPWGGTSAAGLTKLIGGKPVLLEVHGVDPYGRTLATVFARHGSKGQDRQRGEMINVNERMVMLGHAWVMRRYYDQLSGQRRRQLNRLEAWARSKQVGLWNTPSPIPPWAWRRMQRDVRTSADA